MRCVPRLNIFIVNIKLMQFSNREVNNLTAAFNFKVWEDSYLDTTIGYLNRLTYPQLRKFYEMLCKNNPRNNR